MGTWVVDYEEASCHTFWEFFKDKARSGLWVLSYYCFQLTAKCRGVPLKDQG